MDIKNARRILCLGAPGCQALDIVKDLTGTTPEQPDASSIAGLSHSWNVKTAYYTASVPIWLDEINDTTEWQAEFTKPEAKQVVDAIGAWIYCFRDDRAQSSVDKLEQDLKAIQAVIEHHTDCTNDAVMLAVASPVESKIIAMTDDRYARFEDVAIRYSFELIDYAAHGINDYGEKQGLERMKEALEANEWTSAEPDELELGSDNDYTGTTEAEMNAELFDLKAALVEDDTGLQHDSIDAGQEEGVDDLEAMLGKLLAVREQSTELPLAQRKRIAAQAVREVMQSK